MANEEHFKILRQGVEVWNKWRKGRPNIPLDLKGANLSYANLVGANLSSTNLSGANLSKARLSDAKLRGANLSSAFLSGAYLNGANLSGASLIRASFGDADLRGADLSGADLRDASLRSARLGDAVFHEANLNGADLRSAVLSGANLSGVNLGSANLSYANLTRANLRKADLREADLSVANLLKADLGAADFGAANLSTANLNEANLRAANLRYTSLVGAKTDGTNFEYSKIGNTSFSNLDLSLAMGLDKATHFGPSSIGIDTLYKSGGKIPVEFLRGCGIPEDFIPFLPSIIGAREAIQFYSCFISYSTKDEEFARRLYSRMRDEKLRVWFAPEDMKGGKLLHEQIEQAIQLHDRLLVVLSEESMASEWVKREIRNARRAEVREKRRKLFPIRLVDYKAIEEWKGFDGDGGEDLAFELGKFYIPDFSNWKDHDSFEHEFGRLLDALRAEER